MTQRERHASGGVSEASPRSTAGQLPTPPAGSPPGPASHWEEYYQNASPALRNELLALATRQGLLYAHQLPPSTNGQVREPHRHLLARLLAGKTEDLEPIHVQPVEVEDTALDAVQREAVARALQTPDICLIQGLPGTGKTRVAAEIITRAAARGERTLLLAASPAALDHVLSHVRNREVVFAVRSLGREENPDTLAPSIRDLTFAERLRQFREHTLASARQAVSRADDHWARLAGAQVLWQRLEELTERYRGLTEELDALEARRGQIAAEVEQEARQVESAGSSAAVARGHSFSSTLQALHLRRVEQRDRITKAQSSVAAQVAQQQQELTALTAELDRLRPLAEARQHGRWWTWAWWQAAYQGDVSARATEQEGRQKQLQEILAQLNLEATVLAQESEQIEQAYQAERTLLAAAAAARRGAELDDQEAALRQEQSLIQEKWQAACRDLDSDLAPPSAPTRESLHDSRAKWQEQHQQADERRSFARQWSACLEENADTLTARMRDYVNVLAAPITALNADDHFDEAGVFDLLVLEEADRITESEFAGIARRARRWVLIGEPAPEDRKTPSAACASPAPEKSVRNDAHKGKPEHRATSSRAALRTSRFSFFHHLWQQLHCDPRHWPYAWVHEKEGLCCRLRTLLPEQRQWLERERVADSPDIELRILAVPRMPPALAEVVFPPRMSITQAKEYIFRELAELPIRADRHSLRWQEHPEHLVLCLANTPAANPVPVALEHGVRELVAARTAEANGSESPHSSWHTCVVEFDRKAGWHRQRAEEWIARHLGIRDPGRTVRLDIPYRMHPDLAALLSDWLFDGAYDLPPSLPALAGLLPGNGPPAVQFIPVPALTNDRSQRRRNEPAVARAGEGRRGSALSVPRLARAGAGLELDAGDPRHRDRLPLELRANFAGHGFVNFMEAQAVVRTLERLVADPALRTASHSRGTDSSPPVIGVLALYPAQAELIRRLMTHVPSLVAPQVSVKVDVPTAFHEGECLVGLISLTRSHSHRAVNFGEGPYLLTRALTRVRARLILFGDPGTLVRRSEWQNPLDPLDDHASAWEHQLISRLVSYLQGQGAHPHQFQLCEGNRT